MRKLRQPRLADVVAAKLREEILTGHLQEGDLLPSQEQLLKRFRVSLPAIREAMRILETEGLVSVRRGNVGGAVVYQPTLDRVAQLMSMVLQSRRATPDDVSDAVMRIEPICAAMCATRADRATELLPKLREIVAAQESMIDDVEIYNRNARRFHQTLVEGCGSETMIVVLGSLESIWFAHESSVWEEARSDDEPAPDSPMAVRWRKGALREHVKLLAAIEDGNPNRASKLSAAHRMTTRRSTLDLSVHETIRASLVQSDLSLDISGHL